MRPKVASIAWLAGAASFGVTSDHAGNIWFTENFNNKIGRLTPRHH